MEHLLIYPVKKGYLDGLITQFGEDKKMEEMGYWINPCKEIDILIKKLQPLGLASASRTGVVAMTKGSEIYKQR